MRFPGRRISSTSLDHQGQDVVDGHDFAQLVSDFQVPSQYALPHAVGIFLLAIDFALGRQADRNGVANKGPDVGLAHSEAVGEQALADVQVFKVATEQVSLGLNQLDAAHVIAGDGGDHGGAALQGDALPQLQGPG